MQEDDRIILAGMNMVEVAHINILDEEVVGSKMLSRLYNKDVDVCTLLHVKGPVLMKPEPVTFIAERVHVEYNTLWGMIVVYRTGIEVYKKDKKDYKLEYIYKCSAQVVDIRDSIMPYSRVYIVDGIYIVEMKQSGPYIVKQIEKGSIVHVGAISMLVRDTNRVYIVKIPSVSTVTKVSTERKVYTIEDTQNREVEVHRTLIESIELCKEELQNYAYIDYNLVKNKTEIEQMLITEKILNKVKSKICNNVMILELALQEKIKHIEEIAKHTERMEHTVEKKIEALADRNKKILQKMQGVVEAIEVANKEVRTRNSKNKEVEQIKERIRAIKK